MCQQSHLVNEQVFINRTRLVSIKIIEQFLKFFNVTCHMVGKDIYKYVDLVSQFVLGMVPQYSVCKKLSEFKVNIE